MPEKRVNKTETGYRPLHPPPPKILFLSSFHHKKKSPRLLVHEHYKKSKGGYDIWYNMYTLVYATAAAAAWPTALDQKKQASSQEGQLFNTINEYLCYVKNKKY